MAITTSPIEFQYYPCHSVAVQKRVLRGYSEMKISVGCLLRSALEIKAVGVKEGSSIGQKEKQSYVDSYQSRLMELSEADRTCQQSNAQNSPSDTSTVHEPRTSRCSSWIQKRQKKQRSSCQHLLDHRKNKEVPGKKSASALLTKVFDCVDYNKLKNSSRDGNTRPPYLPPEKSACKSRSNSQNWTWNNRLVPSWERSTSRLYVVTLII